MKDAGGREDNKNLFIAWYLNFVAIIVIVLFLYNNNYSYKYIIISIYTSWSGASCDIRIYRTVEPS